MKSVKFVGKHLCICCVYGHSLFLTIDGFNLCSNAKNMLWLYAVYDECFIHMSYSRLAVQTVSYRTSGRDEIE